MSDKRVSQHDQITIKKRYKKFMYLKILFLSLLLISGCAQPLTDSGNKIGDCGNKVGLKFSNDELVCARDGEEAINVINSHFNPLTKIAVGSFWPTQETPEADINRFIEKALSSSKIGSFSSTNKFFTKKIPMYTMLEKAFEEYNYTDLKAASKRYALEYQDNFFIVKRNGNTLKHVEPNLGLNKEHLATISNLIKQIKNQEELMQKRSLNFDEIDNVNAVIYALEKILTRVIVLLK